MKKIRSSKKGFTLAELLIVVAIIGVLVGMSIPIFTTQLEKSREATDIANLRAAKAAITAQYLDDGKAGTWYYDADSGTLKASNSGIVGYGKGTSAKGGCKAFGTYTEDSVVTDQIITCTVTDAGVVTVAFA